jgi:hypothetical protein
MQKHVMSSIDAWLVLARIYRPSITIDQFRKESSETFQELLSSQYYNLIEWSVTRLWPVDRAKSAWAIKGINSDHIAQNWKSRRRAKMAAITSNNIFLEFTVWKNSHRKRERSA